MTSDNEHRQKIRAQHMSMQEFRTKVKDLPEDAAVFDKQQLENSVRHLIRTNAELELEIAKPDVSEVDKAFYRQYVVENEVVIEVSHEQITILNEHIAVFGNGLYL